MTQKDWTVYTVKGGITLWTKDYPGSVVKQFKLKTVVKKDIQTAYRVLKDVEHMNLWYDRVNSVKLLKKISENEGIYLLEYGLPFPFENRISTINGKLDFNARTGKLVVQTNYINHKVPSEKSNMVLINEISSSWEVTKLADGEIEIIHSGHMNPGGNIPLWLINDGVTSGPIKTMKAFIKMFDKYK
ncbi:MAG: hypothetical protein H7X99_02270 [Saprospiraceae bacterium]|nr:hypothetical protein [Saprospiraceae bacterium]